MRFESGIAHRVTVFPEQHFIELDAAIREAIESTGDIYQSDLEELISLNASGKSISDITGLEYCGNLTMLDLGCNYRIFDISPLSSLTNLTTLSLSHNKISDISPLSSLTNLTTLDLLYNEISDISPLSSLTNLTTLVLTYNEISDISPLSSLTNLTTLSLHDNSISDISPLSSLTNLTTLDLYANSISDISPLSLLTNLNTLVLTYNEISNISPLADNIGLDEGDEVYLRYNYLDITADSQAMNDIQTLLDRGVSVSYSPQKKTPLISCR